jgi:DNA-binding transcriptional ArsR family regulator
MSVTQSAIWTSAAAGEADIAGVAGLLGQPARAAMCSALMDGRALSASELARTAKVGAATASEHLSRLVAGGLLTVVSGGRHRYYRLDGSDVADAIEALARLAPPLPTNSLRQSRRAAALAEARSCYDHIAGRLGVQLYDWLRREDALAVTDGGLTVGGNGEPWRRLGIEADDCRTVRRPIVRDCLDWTERRPHLAGLLGSRTLRALLDNQWIRRSGQPRRLEVTNRGREALAGIYSPAEQGGALLRA